MIKKFSFVIFLWSYFMVACTSSTGGDDKVTYSGKVTLEGTSDYSGVTVSLYKPVDLDTALLKINQDYPSIGVQISQQMEFDHREQTALYTTTTSADGSWEIKADDGTYNIVTEKDGYGYRTIFDQEKTSVDQIDLFNEVQLSGNYTTDVNTGADRTIVIENMTTIDNGATLTIGEGCTLVFNNDADLYVNDRMVASGTPEKMIRFEGNPSVNNDIILENNTNSTFTNCIFELKRAAYFKYCTNTMLNQNIVRNTDDGFDFLSCSTTQMRNNIFSGTKKGVLQYSSDMVFEYNAVINCSENGIESYDDKNSMIRYNVFKTCNEAGIAINPGDQKPTNTYLEIFYNDFYDNDIHIDVGNYSDCLVNNNNFFSNVEYAVRTSAFTFNDSLNFELNYWSTTSEPEIKNKIFDRNDRSNLQGYEVVFLNYKFTKINW